MTHVVTSKEALAADLAPLAETINSQSDLILRHEIATQEETIVPRLLIGQSVARAKEIFGLTKAEAGRIGGSKTQRGVLPDEDPATLSLGFQAWLKQATATLPKKLPRQTAEKYATAFQSLRLPADCKPAAIAAAVKDLRHRALSAGSPSLSLAYILKSAEPEKEETESTAIIIPPDSATLRLQDAREAFQKWRDLFEKLLAKGALEDLDRAGLEQLHDFNLGVRDRIKARLK